MNSSQSFQASQQKSLAALILGAIATGFGPIFARLSELGPFATAFWRITLALPFLLLWARSSSFQKKSLRPRGRKLLVLAGIFFAGDLATWHCSIKLTLVTNATLEANLSALFVPLFAWLFFGQRVTRKFLIALAVALVGTLLLIGKTAHISAHSLSGDALAIITALFYSGYLLSAKIARDRGFSTADIMTISGITTSAVLLPLALFSGETLWPSTVQGWAVLFALALFSHFGGQSLIIYALAELPASFASMGLLIQPATAALAAWLLLGELLAPMQILGGLILLLGFWFAKQDPPNKAITRSNP